MSYKPDESALVAYLYGELTGAEKESVERYLAETPEARVELEKLQQVRKLLGEVQDKEVIAPPIGFDNGGSRFAPFTPYIRTILGIAASLVLILVAGRLTGVQINASGQELRISFGEPATQEEPAPPVSATEVRQMINSSLAENNTVLRESWQRSQEALDASIRENLAQNSSRIDKLLSKTSSASEQQISDFAASMQARNMQMIQDYYKLTANEQKQYLEELLVDFSKYLQQQRNDDLMIMQSRMNSIEQNTDIFRQETEQILSSIISNENMSMVKN
jgi:hypothetical protein